MLKKVLTAKEVKARLFLHDIEVTRQEYNGMHLWGFEWYGKTVVFENTGEDERSWGKSHLYTSDQLKDAIKVLDKIKELEGNAVLYPKKRALYTLKWNTTEQKYVYFGYLATGKPIIKKAE